MELSYSSTIWKHVISFGDMQAREIYELLKLRQDIFIIEQNCIYEDIDNLDPVSEHLLLYQDKRLAGILRIVPPGIKFDDASIGRIAVHPDFRNRGLGKKLIQRSLSILKKRGELSVRIEAQQHLEAFYNRLGFRTVSTPYDLDGITHIEMILESRE